jgi:hypothetical protein
MAKKTKNVVAAPVIEAPKNTPVTAPEPEDAPETPKAVRESKDVFARAFANGTPVAPSKKLPPQAQVIVNTLEAAGPDGLQRSELVENLKPVLVTRQPVGRILSYYQKILVETGAVVITSNE